MSQPLLPDPPDKFSSYDAWIKLSTSASSRWRALWIGRDALLSNLDSTIAFHEREHGRLAAAYEEKRHRYLVAHETFTGTTPGSSAEWDCLRVMVQHLQAAVHVYGKLIDGRRRVERKFEAWMDLHGFDGRAKGRSAHRQLSQRRRRMRQERQDALSHRLALENMLANTRKRLEEFNQRCSEGTPAAVGAVRESGVAYASIHELNEFLARFASGSESDEAIDQRLFDR